VSCIIYKDQESWVQGREMLDLSAALPRKREIETNQNDAGKFKVTE
jgi:hypothetical protein